MMSKVLLLVFIFIAVNANANIYQTVPTGFQDMKWGDSPKSDMGILEVDPTDPNHTTYMQIGKHIGNIPVESITYEFYTGKFDVVNLVLDTVKNCRDIKAVLTSLYGVEPYRPNKYIDKYMWFNNYEGDITTVFLYVPTMDTCIVNVENSLINKVAKEQHKQDNIERAKGAM